MQLYSGIRSFDEKNISFFNCCVPFSIQDYVGKDVTPDNFLRVLTGDAEGMKGIGSGKVSGKICSSNVMFYL